MRRWFRGLAAAAGLLVACGIVQTEASIACDGIAADLGQDVRTVGSFDTTIGKLRDDRLLGMNLEPLTVRNEDPAVLCYLDGDLPMPALQGGGVAERTAIAWHSDGNWSVLLAGREEEIPVRAP